MSKADVWPKIHAERAAMADTWEGLSASDWQVPSLCAGWSVAEAAGHIVAAAEQTPPHFFIGLASNRFSFNALMDRDAHQLGALPPETLIRRLRARTTTTNHPPAPAVAMLGEIVVHGEDIRRPLGLAHRPPEATLIAVADSWKNSNLLIGAKKRISGLRLRATDSRWTHGDGPEVAGPLAALVLAMTGRKAALADLTGEGVAILGARS